MEPVPPLSIGARIIAEFEDDAAGGAATSGTSQGATVSAQPVRVDSGPADPTDAEGTSAIARRPGPGTTPPDAPP